MNYRQGQSQTGGAASYILGRRGGGGQSLEPLMIPGWNPPPLWGIIPQTPIYPLPLTVRLHPINGGNRLKTGRTGIVSRVLRNFYFLSVLPATSSMFYLILISVLSASRQCFIWSFSCSISVFYLLLSVFYLVLFSVLSATFCVLLAPFQCSTCYFQCYSFCF